MGPSGTQEQQPVLAHNMGDRRIDAPSALHAANVTLILLPDRDMRIVEQKSLATFGDPDLQGLEGVEVTEESIEAVEHGCRLESGVDDAGCRINVVGQIAADHRAKRGVRQRDHRV